MLTGYADLAFQFGLADENQAEYINSETQNAAKLIDDGKYYEAFQVCLHLIPLKNRTKSAELMYHYKLILLSTDL